VGLPANGEARVPKGKAKRGRSCSCSCNCSLSVAREPYSGHGSGTWQKVASQLEGLPVKQKGPPALQLATVCYFLGHAGGPAVQGGRPASYSPIIDGISKSARSAASYAAHPPAAAAISIGD